MSDGEDQILDAMAAEAARRAWEIEDKRLAEEGDDEEVTVSGFDLEKEVQLGQRCPVCGQDQQYLNAGLLEVKISCYCSPSSSVNVLAETEAEAKSAWAAICEKPVAPISWFPVRHVPPPVGRFLVTVERDAAVSVSIARWDGTEWRPEGLRPIAWAMLPEPWL